MLKLIVGEKELYDEVTNTFSTVGGFVLELEHSLISVSKWESEFQKPFLVGGKKTTVEVLAYIKEMILTLDYPYDVLTKLSEENLRQVNDYIESTQSATTFGMMPQQKGRAETITSELIYYWMVAFNIPFECETWHLNRLFSLIRICNVKNSKPKKMSQREIANRNRELNAERRARLGTTG